MQKAGRHAQGAADIRSWADHRNRVRKRARYGRTRNLDPLAELVSAEFWRRHLGLAAPRRARASRTRELDMIVSSQTRAADRFETISRECHPASLGPIRTDFRRRRAVLARLPPFDCFAPRFVLAVDLSRQDPRQIATRCALRSLPAERESRHRANKSHGRGSHPLGSPPASSSIAAKLYI